MRDAATGLVWYTRGLYGYDSPISPRDPVAECAALGMKPARFAEVEDIVEDPASLPWALPYGVFATSPSIHHRVEEPGCADLVYGVMSPDCETLDGLFCVERPSP